MKILDTNVLIHYLKGDPAIVSRISQASPNELAIPSIVLYEIEYGTLRSRLSARRRTELEKGLEYIRCVPFDAEAAFTAARIRIDLKKRGVSIGPLDVLIAGTAMSLGAVLVTNNHAEFSRVPGLRIADWKS